MLHRYTNPNVYTRTHPRARTRIARACSPVSRCHTAPFVQRFQRVAALRIPLHLPLHPPNPVCSDHGSAADIMPAIDRVGAQEAMNGSGDTPARAGFEE